MGLPGGGKSIDQETLVRGASSAGRDQGSYHPSVCRAQQRFFKSRCRRMIEQSTQAGGGEHDREPIAVAEPGDLLNPEGFLLSPEGHATMPEVAKWPDSLGERLQKPCPGLTAVPRQRSKLRGVSSAHRILEPLSHDCKRRAPWRQAYTRSPALLPGSGSAAGNGTYPGVLRAREP
jgi:hypothetical protein